MIGYGFKTFYNRKSGNLSQELDRQLNEFFTANKHLRPKSIGLTSEKGFSLTATVLYEYDEGDSLNLQGLSIISNK